ncbi:MAG: HD domain-containing protein [Ruminococcus sp.]|nr:HD domain-containing protein [Ruminococcus sp.]
MVVLAVLMAGAGCQLTCFADEAAAEEAETEELSVDPTGQVEGYSAVLYDNVSGLPTSEANAIVETEEGFIWIGSYSGLIRYDGNTFERIDSTTGIASVVSLYADSENRLWVGTNDSGAAVIEKGEIKMYGTADGLRSLSVRSVAEDDEGNIFLATTHGIAVVNDKLEMSPLDEPQINDEYVRTLEKCGDTIYGVTMGGAVFTIKNKRLTGFYGADKLGINDIHSILPDPDRAGYVYVGNKGNQLFYGDLSRGLKDPVTVDISPLEYINNIGKIGDMIWVCTDQGIGFVEDGKFRVVGNVPMNTSVEEMLVDYQGNLWFVSSQQGVMKIVPNRFTDVFAQYGLEDEVVYSTCMYNDRLFVGTKNSGLRVMDHGRNITKVPVTEAVTASGKVLDDTDLVLTLEGCKIRSIFRDSRNRVWFSTFGEQALLRYDNGKLLKFTPEDGLPSDRVRAVYEKKDGSFMVCCTGGLVIIEDDKITEVFDEADGLTDTEILTAVECDNGEMLLGTDGGGIYVINGHKITHIGTDDGLSSDVVLRLKNDISRDIIWLVTSNAIGYMTPDHKITMVNKFPYSNNFDLYENSRGEMWVLSSNGIYVETVEELMENGEMEPIYYGMDNGLPSIATSNSYSELTDEGDLYIAGTTGVAKVNIEEVFEKVDNVRMAVPYIEADDVRVYPNDNGEFVISSDVSKVTVFSFVYNYSLVNPDVIYRLEGFENKNNTLRRSELVPVDYTNLRGGTYHFVMQIKDQQGVSSNELDVVIIKQKAFFEQWWFMLLMVLLLAVIVGTLVKLYIDSRTRRFLKKEKEQKQLIREIVEAFAKVIDMKDKYTNGHSSRVAEYTSMLTKELGYDDETVEKYYNIALLHDIGKVGVPPEVLNKPGKLTDTEFNIIKSHSALGYNALKDISIMPELAIGAGAHHERPDGKGYPKGLKGEDIPRVAQIIAVADTFDAMYSDRPYRKRMNFDKVVSIMKEVRGTQLTGDVVDAFLRLVDKGEFRSPDDHGGGSTEDIDNIHRKFDKESKVKSVSKSEK